MSKVIYLSSEQFLYSLDVIFPKEENIMENHEIYEIHELILAAEASYRAVSGVSEKNTSCYDVKFLESLKPRTLAILKKAAYLGINYPTKNGIMRWAKLFPNVFNDFHHEVDDAWNHCELGSSDYKALLSINKALWEVYTDLLYEKSEKARSFK